MASNILSGLRRSLGVAPSRGPYPLMLRRVPGLGAPPACTQDLSMMLHADDQDHVSVAIRQYGYWEPHETRILCAHAKPGAVALDVGANIGYHSMLIGSLVGAQGRVFAFEPAHDNFQLLEANAALNKLGNVTAIPAAVSDRSGLVALNRYALSRSADSIIDIKGADFSHVDVVPSVTLDELMEVGVERVDLLKMDIQGAELRALQGARKLLQHNRANLTILLEYNVGVYVEQGAGQLATTVLDELRDTFDVRYCDPSIGEFFPLDMPSADFIEMVAGAGGTLPNGATWTKSVGYSDLWATPRA